MANRIKYYSTNHKAPEVTFKEALLTGQAPDKGLYMPRPIPSVSNDFLESLRDMEYHEIAFNITNLFLSDEVSEEKLKWLTKDAYDYEVPLENVFGRNYVMRLDRGPSASFKDFAARMMARLMQYYLEEEERQIVILTATSGDTGGAIANAFFGLDYIKIIVLFPIKEVSERQRRQMTTLGGNVTTIAVDGKFDDCQSLVKQAFADPDLSYLNLSSANSINFGRLLPQTVYYFYSYLKLKEGDESVVFAVPSGNFGDLLGGLVAKFMGLPVSRFVVATNSNDEFPKYVETGKYETIVPSIKCISNAMNVGHPSNLARLFDLYGGQMDEKGNVSKYPYIEKVRKDMFALSINEDETRMAIKNVYDKYNLVMEPHGAVGWAGLGRFLKEENYSGLAISLETAHPAKFPEEIERILSISPEPPDCLKELDKSDEEYEQLSSEYSVFKDFLQNLSFKGSFKGF